MTSLKKIYNYSLILISLFPLMSLKLAGLIIGLWALLSLVVIVKIQTFKKINKNDILNIIILSALYFFYIGNYLFTLDTILIKELETSLSFLIFPLFIILNKSCINKNTLEYSLKGFFISNSILALITWFKIFEIGFLKLIKENNYYQPVFRNIFSDTTNIHLPYLGLFFVFSIFIGIYILQNEYKKHIFLIKVGLISLCLVFFISILFFSARMALLSLIFSFVYWSYRTIQNKLLFRGVFVSLIIFAITVVFLTPMKDRIRESLTIKLELPSEKNNDNSKVVNFRYSIYHCSLTIIKNNWLMGVGKNNVQKELNKCYDNFTYQNYDDFSKKKYNSHNQYLDLFLSYGIFGMVVLTISFFWGYHVNNDLFFNLFLIIVFLALLTENIFDRQLGVVFFTFFNTLFFIKDSNK